MAPTVISGFHLKGAINAPVWRNYLVEAKRVLPRFGVAVVIVSFIVGLSFTLFGLSSTSFGGGPNSLLDLLALATVVGVLALLPVNCVGLILALPLAVLMKKARVKGALAWGGVGAVTGGLAILAYSVVQSGGMPETATLEGTLAVAAIGMPPGMFAGLFWWFGVIKRDQKETNMPSPFPRTGEGA